MLAFGTSHALGARESRIRCDILEHLGSFICTVKNFVPVHTVVVCNFLQSHHNTQTKITQLHLSLSLSSWLLQHTYYSISGDGLVVVVVVLLGITRAEDWPDDHSSGMHTAAPSALCLLLDTVCCCCKSQAATRSLKFLAKQLTTRAILLLLPTYTFFATTTTDQNENPNKRWWDGEGRKEESIHPKPIASKASRELEIQ